MRGRIAAGVAAILAVGAVLGASYVRPSPASEVSPASLTASASPDRAEDCSHSDALPDSGPLIHGTLKACPGQVAIGSKIAITGTGCNNPGAPAIIYFGSVGYFGLPTTAQYGSSELGRFEVDASGRFDATVSIPANLSPIQGSGGGSVTPGKYAIYSKPDYCRTYLSIP